MCPQVKGASLVLIIIIPSLAVQTEEATVRRRAAAAVIKAQFSLVYVDDTTLCEKPYFLPFMSFMSSQLKSNTCQ